ncbi:MAG: fatty acid--CoA ligase family protein [Burkholderiaceae bacterium]|nr:fatty acid--CoA ligase family protein [Burkholderiaceae bacterium]
MNVADIIDQHARERAFAVALLTERWTISFGALDQMVWWLAARIARLELPAGAAIALSFRSQALHAIASLAAFRAGIAQISIAAESPELLGRALILRTAAAVVLSDDAAMVNRYGITVVAVDANEMFIAQGAIDRGVRRVGPDAPALYVPGSGTTGEPRIITYTTRGLLGLLERERAIWPVRRDERHLMLSSFDYFTSKRHTFAFLAGGGAAVFLDQPTAIYELCDRLAVDHLSMVVPQAWRLLWLLRGMRAHGSRLPRLRSLILGGSPVSEQLRRRLRASVSANTWVRCGMNEFGQATIATPEIQDLHPGSVGRPCSGVEIEVVDDDDRPLPRGTAGHVRVRGEGGFSHYLGDPEATARALRGGWFYPGDLGLLTSDGTLVFKGRSDDLMIFDGINVYPREIESVLEQHPAVVEAVAFPLASTTRNQLLAAAVEVSVAVDESELRAFCRERLGVKAPARIVVADRLPRNASGKVLKRELAKMAGVRWESHLAPGG